MVSITLSVPEDLKKKMDQFPEINWSGLIRKVLNEKIGLLVLKEQMMLGLQAESDFTDWSVTMGRKLKTARFDELKRKKIL